MLRLRPFKKCDADTVISWIKSEKIFRFWCADRFESYPITGQDLVDQYEGLAGNDDIFHFVMYDENGIAGHFNIRFPDRNDIDTVRLGYVIVDDSRRGQGLGKQMIKMAIDYAFEFMGAQKVTIGVFRENPAALNCYLASGFCDTGVVEHYSCMGEDWECLELEISKAKSQ
ncbi:Protein N-acetyltransferase, RimJ/RimL family [Ruminococcaceae bacterium YRB3002]|nr:Protein N-acetyltransferase, RimJ/RimL family [Ruminococcaceae bacterium YRB3002]